MRKITEQASKAFWGHYDFKMSNTQVKSEDLNIMVLHDTAIAWLDNGELVLNTGGYRTNVTKERLNGILSEIGHVIFQKNWVWYLENRAGTIVEFEDFMRIKL